MKMMEMSYWIEYFKLINLFMLLNLIKKILKIMGKY